MHSGARPISTGAWPSGERGPPQRSLGHDQGAQAGARLGLRPVAPAGCGGGRRRRTRLPVPAAARARAAADDPGAEQVAAEHTEDRRGREPTAVPGSPGAAGSGSARSSAGGHQDPAARRPPGRPERKTSRLRPTVMVLPSRRSPVETRSPSTKVPLVEPRSPPGRARRSRGSPRAGGRRRRRPAGCRRRRSGPARSRHGSAGTRGRRARAPGGRWGRAAGPRRTGRAGRRARRRRAAYGGAA